MATFRAIGLLVLLAALAACAGSPLPRKEIPPDFYFFYRAERPFPGPASPAAKPSPAPVKAPAKAPGKGPAAPGKKPSRAPAKPVAPGKVEVPRPVMIQIELEADGSLAYRIRHLAPRPADWKEERTLSSADLRKAYDAIREAHLFDMEDRYAGEDEALGTETFYVMGRERRSKEIVVEGTTIPTLATLRNRLFTLLDLKWTPPKPSETGFVLDLRTGKIHRVGCPQLKGVPPASRRTSGRVEALVNVPGAYPCEECRPLERRE